MPDVGAVQPWWRGVRLVDGRTGATRWRAHLFPVSAKASGGQAEVLVAPDLDGDGVREMVIVSVLEGSSQPAIYVDAISGKHGTRLWWWKEDVQAYMPEIGRPQWWGHGPDGWPMLALPLGGERSDRMFRRLQREPVPQSVVHLLEASTGRERHTVLGLASAGFADLDGDGLTDLWGEADGELRLFAARRRRPGERWGGLTGPAPRSEVPAVCRAVGMFGAPDAAARTDLAINQAVDFDGDGVADALIAPVEAPGHIRHKTTGSITALARSGRDGRVIWRKQIDPLENWLEPQSGDTYELSAFPLPVGDIDRDGTADVIVRKWLGAGRLAKRRGVTLAVELLSGRTGATIWSGGPSLASSAFQGLSAVDWAEPCVVEANGTPDVIVGLNVAGARCSLARVSGRDGRVRWEAALSDAKVGYGGWVRFFDDFDGDGSADALVLLPGVPNMPRSDHALVAISLRTGKQLWSQELHYMFPSYAGEPHVGDVDGDGRPDVVTLEDFAAGKEPEPRIRVFDGRDGSLRWTWWLPKEQFPNPRSRAIALANFRGDGTRDVCLSFHSPYPGGRRILVLDSQGKERAHRDVVDAASSALKAGDLDGDGRDELLVSYGGRVHAWDRDLKELWSSPTSFETVDQIVPATPGPPREVILMPAVALDAATGRPRWTGQAPLVQSSPQFMPRMLDAGDATRPPLLLGDGLGATVCRVAMATEANGSIAPPRGQTVRVRGWAQNDPRWARPLPVAHGPCGRNWSGGILCEHGACARQCGIASDDSPAGGEAWAGVQSVGASDVAHRGRGSADFASDTRALAAGLPGVVALNGAARVLDGHGGGAADCLLCGRAGWQRDPRAVAGRPGAVGVECVDDGFCCGRMDLA